MKESKQELIWGEYYTDSRTGRIVRYVPLHPGQQAIFDSESRFLFFIGGKGSGKSSFAPLWLEREIRRRPMGKYIICADTYNRLEQGVLPEWFKSMEHSDLKGEFRQTKHIYTTSTGATIYVRSLDMECSVEGIHAEAIVVDEGLYLSRTAYDILESRVHLRRGKILCCSTPYKTKRWGVEIIERFKQGDPNYFVWQGGSAVNPAVSEEEIERQRQRLPRWRFEMDYMGLFTKPSGVVYPDMDTCVVDPQPLPEGRCLAGCDFGFGGNPSACIVGILDRDNVLWCFFELYWKPLAQESSFNGFAKRLKEWHNSFYATTGRVIERIYCDSANDTYRQLRSFRLNADDNGPRLNARPAKKGHNSVAAGIDIVSSRIAENKLKLIRRATPALLFEADEYRWDVSEDDDTSNVLRGADHLCDGLRYLCSSIDRKKGLV